MSREASPLLTDELRLDPLRAEDAEELAPLLDDARLHEFIGGAPLPAAELEARYRRLADGAPQESGQTWFNRTVRRRSDGRTVGTAQATMAGRDAGLAWVIGSEWQRRGYATQVARALVAWAADKGLAAHANIHPEHAASERVAERAGMRPSGDVTGGERVWRHA